MYCIFEMLSYEYQSSACFSHPDFLTYFVEVIIIIFFLHLRFILFYFLFIFFYFRTIGIVNPCPCVVYSEGYSSCHVIDVSWHVKALNSFRLQWMSLCSQSLVI